MIWRKNGDADQPMKMSGSMRKIYQRAKETKRQELKEKGEQLDLLLAVKKLRNVNKIGSLRNHDSYGDENVT